MSRRLAILAIALAACGDDGGQRAQTHDAAIAYVDAPPDAHPDARPDAPPDAACPITADATVSGTLQVTCDDNFILYVNGVLIDDTARVWSDPQTYTITLARSPAVKNVIAIEGLNTAEIDGFDRGVIADLAFVPDGSVDGTPVHVLTDDTWLLSPTLVDNWFAIGLDDTAWTAAIDEGPDGMSPWGDVLGASTARWLWSYPSSGPASDKPAAENIYLRKSFFIDQAGDVTAAPVACP